MSFQVSSPTVGNKETFGLNGNCEGNLKETMGLKALAVAILNKIHSGNFKETTPVCEETKRKQSFQESFHPAKSIRLQNIRDMLRYEGPITRNACIWAIREKGYTEREASRLLQEGTGTYWREEPGVTGKEVYRPLFNARISSDSVPTQEANNGKQ